VTKPLTFGDETLTVASPHLGQTKVTDALDRYRGFAKILINLDLFLNISLSHFRATVPERNYAECCGVDRTKCY
jgi:hypothetical protein